MPIIVLMRHAHAEMPAPGMRDFDRPLSNSGQQDARTITKQFSNTPLKVSTIFCSPARRTMETLVCARETIHINTAAIHYPSELYSGEVGAYYHVLSKLAQDDVCMIIGHNPMIESFAFDIAQTGDETGLAKLKLGFPTAAMAVVELATTFDPASPNGKLNSFFSPN